MNLEKFVKVFCFLKSTKVIEHDELGKTDLNRVAAKKESFNICQLLLITSPCLWNQEQLVCGTGNLFKKPLSFFHGTNKFHRITCVAPNKLLVMKSKGLQETLPDETNSIYHLLPMMLTNGAYCLNTGI